MLQEKLKSLGYSQGRGATNTFRLHGAGTLARLIGWLARAIACWMPTWHQPTCMIIHEYIDEFMGIVDEIEIQAILA